MIFYYKLDNNLQEQKKNITNNLEMQLNMQETNLKILLECLKHVNDVIQNNEDIETINELIELLKEIKTNLEKLRNSISKLKKMQDMIKNLPADLTDSAMTDKLEEYNKLAREYQDNISDIIPVINNFILEYVRKTSFSIDMPKIIETPKISIKDEDKSVKDKELAEENVTLDKEDDIEKGKVEDNNKLLISEVQNKVFLPYSISELNIILEKNKNYRNLQEIIENEYIISLDKYKNAIIARFREAYNLMRKKEDASITDSLDLALELSFNNLLNPAIITACKNLDELDIYLDCLSSNELDKFNIFEIEYEILPKYR